MHPLDRLLREESREQVMAEYGEASEGLAVRLGVPLEQLADETGRRLRGGLLEEDEQVMRWLRLREAAEDWRGLPDPRPACAAER